MQHITRHIAVTAIIAVAAVGCVSSGKFDALQADRDAIHKELSETKIHVGVVEQESALKQKSLEDALAAEKSKSAALETQIAQLKADQAARQAELAAMVKDKSKLKASVDQMALALADLQARKAASDKRVAEYKGLLDRFKSLIDAGKLQVKIVDGRMVVALASDILFASGAASLSKDGKQSLTEVAAILSSIPDRKFQVEGHTDNVPVKSGTNWDLAAARAITVLQVLVAGGMSADRVSAASFADTRPAAPNDTPEGRALNRRIEIVVVPDLSTLPGFDELKKIGG